MFTTFVQHEQLPRAFSSVLHFLASIHQLPEVVLEQIPHLEPIARGIYIYDKITNNNNYKVLTIFLTFFFVMKMLIMKK